MRVLIAGCGYLGRELARRLADRGAEVHALRRSATPPPPGVRAVVADLLAPDSLTALPRGLDAAVYAASASVRDDEAYRRIYVEGVGHLLERLAADSPGLRRFLLVSSTAVYAQQGGAWVDEDSPTQPLHFSGRRLLEGEALAAAAPLPGPVLRSVLRLGGLYGPGRSSLLDRVERGQATLPADGPRYVNRIHLDDAAGALVHLLGLPRPPAVLLGVDSEPADLALVLHWLARRLGAPEPRTVAGAADGRRAAGNKRCRNARLLACGYALRHPTFREGYGALIEARRALGSSR